ncbi:uncharacterized protein BT62DRAFT_1010816 [Guyanagaster necrorhizus]|uniref:Uncharacterized protein n=1 Tax=Guyanagaster necrorhizus TaxID=856835 RepID=A0A9P7VLC5_9AGAR|nr:uncharacterized protein BT62DRAFT_1010816 [Guyanagaster necrorhizus MCA 3950]KAG7442034.1 hypothetical protein BT62DRAFT_1010816 [Guyanagaster necrorhizus MCA 3950]
MDDFLSLVLPAPEDAPFLLEMPDISIAVNQEAAPELPGMMTVFKPAPKIACRQHSSAMACLCGFATALPPKPPPTSTFSCLPRPFILLHSVHFILTSSLSF